MKEAASIEEEVRRQLVELLPRLRRFARVLTRDPADADDLVQVALERALTRANQWRRDTKLAGWMFGIMRNAWIDEVRSRQRRGQTFLPEEAGEDVGTSPARSDEIALSIRQAVLQLPEDQRTAVMLVLVEGLSYAEAAEVLDLPEGTLTSRLARARVALQRMLGEQESTP